MKLQKPTAPPNRLVNDSWTPNDHRRQHKFELNYIDSNPFLPTQNCSLRSGTKCLHSESLVLGLFQKNCVFMDSRVESCRIGRQRQEEHDSTARREE